MTPATPLALAAAGLVAVAAATLTPSAPAWMWNTTASAPEGLYRLRPIRALAVGQWVAVRPPPALARWLAARGAVPSGVLLLKRIAALAPSTVCRRGDRLWVDGAPRVRLRAWDSRGRALPQWRPCGPLAADEVLLLNDAPGSLDSRYFGTVPRGAVVARAFPAWPVEGGR